MIIDKENVLFFWGGYLSQWQECRFSDHVNSYNCAEQYMMYKKATLFKDFEIADQILNLNDPEKVKALGRKIKGFDERIWKAFRFDVVVNGNLLKFSQDHKLAASLLSTYPKKLAEASPYDKIWGIGMSADDKNVYNTCAWGENLLGKALMQVRRIILIEKDFEKE